MRNLHITKTAISALMIMMLHQHAGFGQSVARKWNETHLACIRLSFAKPTIHALHLKRMGIAMYDAWAVFDTVASPYMLGQTQGSFTCAYEGFPITDTSNIENLRNKAISYAAYTYLKHHFQQLAPNEERWQLMLNLMNTRMDTLGYDAAYYSNDYTTGDAAALGIYIAEQLDAWSLVDGTNEQNNFSNQIYDTENFELNPNFPGNQGAVFPNQWQSLDLQVCTDQNGNPQPCANAAIIALSPEWGWVDPFSLNECQLTYHERSNIQWPVYLDQGAPPYLEDTNYLPDSILGPNVNMFKYGFLTTLMWHWFHNNPDAGLIDTSPNNIGNLNIVLNPDEPGELGPDDLPSTPTEFADFYNLYSGQVPDPGYSVNPVTQQPYSTQFVPMGDYSRAIAQYWADGPNSETPPGHWFVILNEVSDALTEKRWRGENNPIISDLEWDVKSYFTLGGGIHDAAIACWSAKGAYDYTRPLYAIRTMAEYGQCTNPEAPNFHVNGLPLIPDYIEFVTQADIDNPTLNFDTGDLNKIKISTWLGPYGFLANNGVWQGTHEDGHGWKLALEWWTYQVASFVTPPFPGYYSGHSTYSRTAAEILTQITGSPYFPGGIFESVVTNFFADTDQTPASPIHLQWASYRDAADQCSISRIFGGLHPPQDDIPGRRVGLIIGNQAVDYAERFMHANAPQVVSLATNIVNPASGTYDFSVGIHFSEAINTDLIPLVIPTGSTPVVSAGSYWANDSLLIALFNLTESTNSINDISFHVSGFEPAEWQIVGDCPADTINLPLPYLSSPFDIETNTNFCSETPQLVYAASDSILNCNDAIPYFSAAFSIADGSLLTIEHTDSIVAGASCSYYVLQIATAFNECGDSLSVSRTLTFASSCFPTIGETCDDGNPCTINDIIQAECSCQGTFADFDNDGICDTNDPCNNTLQGTSCDDADPCTVNDVIQADCSCLGTFADLDSDGICDAADPCNNTLQGTSCDDADPCTVNDVIQADCSCLGTFADYDNDGICDANDPCDSALEGTSCDDNDACTVNDVIQADCSCHGTFADLDNDGICDTNDPCNNTLQGTSCDDADACTVNDVIQADCSCLGIFADLDNDGICDTNDPCNNTLQGTSCDDADACTVNDVIQADCSCLGTFTDLDNDGICDTNDPCNNTLQGTSCDDDNACTVNDVIQADCSCQGTFADLDSDGICDASDPCNNTLDGTSCDDGNPCTINDAIQADCSCAGLYSDIDNDGVCDALEIAGCTDANACNFDVEATDDDGSCTYVELMSIEGDLTVTAGDTSAYTYAGLPSSTYEWTITGGNIIDGQGSNTVTIVWGNSATGELSVVETTNQNCTGVEQSVTIDIQPNSVDSFLPHDFSIYPNPAQHTLNITGTFNARDEVCIYDYVGQCVYRGMYTSTLNVNALASGLYYLHIQHSGRALRKPFTIVR